MAARSNGLDTLRAFAIMLVFAYHYSAFVSHEATFGWASSAGWVGVDLFFVLSGYLIANQLLSGIAKNQLPSLPLFYARRALRTLPAFWLVLAVYFVFPHAMEGRTPPSLWTFLSFTQNAGLLPGTAFSHAWSLCIEEQFYLILPVLLIVGLRVGAGRSHGWFVLAALLVVGIAARAIAWQSCGLESSANLRSYYPNIYYATVCRFDEFLPGVAVAMLKNFHRPVWDRIIRNGNSLLMFSMLATAGVLYLVCRYYYIDGYGYGFFMTAFGYSLVSIAFSLLVVAALSPTSLLQRMRVPGAYPLALWSYSIYLSHKAVAHFVQQQMSGLRLPDGVGLVVITLACLFVGALLHRFVEAPFMRVRNRMFPTNFPLVGPLMSKTEALPASR